MRPRMIILGVVVLAVLLLSAEDAGLVSAVSRFACFFPQVAPGGKEYRDGHGGKVYFPLGDV